MFPVTINNNTDKVMRSLLEGKVIVGGFWAYPENFAFDGTQTPEANGGNPGTPGGFQPVSGYSCNRTKSLLIMQAHVYVSAETWVSLNFGQAIQNGRIAMVGSETFQGPFLIHYGEGATISMYGLVRPTNPVGNKVLATFGVSGSIISCDLNWGAEKSIMVLADSNTEGGATTSSATAFDMWHWILRGKYRKDWGQDVRLIDKSEGGKTSSNFETYRTTGNALSLMEAPSLIIYNLGTNDTDATVAQSNLSKFINWSLVMYPNAKILVLGSVKRQDAGETLLTTIRANQKTVVDNLANPNVIFINGSLAFSASDNSMYSGTESVGSGIHMSIAGQAALAAYVINQINTVYPAFKSLSN